MQTIEERYKKLADIFHSPEIRAFKKRNLTEENFQKIISIKNKYKNKRCFIVGSSPSLNLLDLTKLNNEYTFTVNRGYMLKEKGLCHSNFHVISDESTFKDADSKYKNLLNYSDYLFCYGGMEPPVDMETIYFDFLSYKWSNGVSFCNDLCKPLISYQSVIHFAIQIAYYLGFNKIYILGVDLDFAKNKGHAYIQTKGEEERQSNHSIKQAKTMLWGIERCGEWLKENNTELLNASPKGVVDCIKRVAYEDLF